jgi:hypothetical protein
MRRVGIWPGFFISLSYIRLGLGLGLLAFPLALNAGSWILVWRHMLGLAANLRALDFWLVIFLCVRKKYRQGKTHPTEKIIFFLCVRNFSVGNVRTDRQFYIFLSVW